MHAMLRPDLIPNPQCCSASKAKSSCRVFSLVFLCRVFSLHFVLVGFNLVHFGGHRIHICFRMINYIIPQRRKGLELSFWAEILLKIFVKKGDLEECKLLTSKNSSKNKLIRNPPLIYTGIT